jgi:Domain of unknown function (DUF397)
MTDDGFARWRKSSYSDANGGCVEVAADERVIGVRDTRQFGQGPVIEFPAPAWLAFIASTKE